MLDIRRTRCVRVLKTERVLRIVLLLVRVQIGVPHFLELWYRLKSVLCIA